MATTIAAIAKAADIPAPTIYSAFGSKADILRDIAWRRRRALDVDRQHDSATPSPTRPSACGGAANPARQYETMYDVIDICQEAARTDPEIAGTLETIPANRERASAATCPRSPTGCGPRDAAVDVYLALVLPEVYRTLVVERGWSAQRYEVWLATTMIRDLLNATTSPE